MVHGLPNNDFCFEKMFIDFLAEPIERVAGGLGEEGEVAVKPMSAKND